MRFVPLPTIAQYRFDGASCWAATPISARRAAVASIADGRSRRAATIAGSTVPPTSSAMAHASRKPAAIWL